MSRTILIVSLLLATSLAVNAQVVANTVPVPYAYGGYATNGSWVTSLPVSWPMMTTPVVRLGSAPLPVGATNATPGMPVGASSFTQPVSVVSPAPVVVPLMTGTQPILLEESNSAVEPQVLEVTEGVSITTSATPPAPKGSPVTKAAVPFNFGLSPIGSMDQGINNGKSLAEVAAENRAVAAEKARNSQNYSNQDIDQLHKKDLPGTSGR